MSRAIVLALGAKVPKGVGLRPADTVLVPEFRGSIINLTAGGEVRILDVDDIVAVIE